MYCPDFAKLNTTNKNDILKVIRGTKRKLAMLKNKMEHPNYKNDKKPSELTIYKCERDFLDLAICRYIALGGKYEDSEADKKDKLFNDSLKNVKEIEFRAWSSFFWSTNIIIHLSNEKVELTKDGKHVKTNHDKKDFLKELASLHIGEWRQHYNTKKFGFYVLDGPSWHLKFKYINKKTKTYSGDSSHPYNLNELLLLFNNLEGFSNDE